MRKLVEFFVQNQAMVVVTFEVFWIAVFLLEAASSSSGAEVSGFVYANF